MKSPAVFTIRFSFQEIMFLIKAIDNYHSRNLFRLLEIDDSKNPTAFKLTKDRIHACEDMMLKLKSYIDKLQTTKKE